MDRSKIQLVLNTRQGTLDNREDFSSCLWHLKDPIFSPLQDTSLYVEVDFCAIPFDHDRINVARGTTRLKYQVHDTVTKTSSEHVIEIPNGTYDIQELYNTVYETIKKETPSVNISIGSFKASRIYTGRTYKTLVELKSDTYKARLIWDPSCLLLEVLGFYQTTPWFGKDSDAEEISSTSVPDIQGTRTMTICSTTLAGESPDPVNLERRRRVLRIIPLDTQALHEPIAITTAKPSSGHFIESRVIDRIHIELLDDMGTPFNPGHHWSLGLEIYAGRREHFLYRM